VNFSHGLLSNVWSSHICGAYYDLCHAHPPRPEVVPIRATARDVLKMAEGRLSISKQSGHGTTFQVGDMPNGSSLNFIIHGYSAVEASFSLLFEKGEVRGTFATLCNAATAYGNAPAHNPPYPRPEFRSIEELLETLEHLSDLFRELLRLTEEKRSP
jgi:hypothetical protein